MTADQLKEYDKKLKVQILLHALNMPAAGRQWAEIAVDRLARLPNPQPVVQSEESILETVKFYTNRANCDQELLAHCLYTRQLPIPQAPALRLAVLKFAHLMEWKLRLNDYRPGWKNEPKDWLLDRLMEEVQELKVAHPGKLTAYEAADVANFAMMIADNEWQHSIDEALSPAPQAPQIEGVAKHVYDLLSEAVDTLDRWMPELPKDARPRELSREIHKALAILKAVQG